MSNPPRLILDAIYAFPPNRNTLGGTAYFILSKDKTGQPFNLMVDFPALEQLDFIQTQGGLHSIFITHRNGISRPQDWYRAFNCPIVIQEQEAYLLPQIPTVTFQESFRFDNDCNAFWTAGYSPGSACLYAPFHGGILFTGRHLLPNKLGELNPLRFSKTFHWPRQLRSVEQLKANFNDDTLAYLCPGANTGFLRGKRLMDQGYQQLQNVDLEACQTMQPLL